jgi:hypothetical protein
LRKLQDEPYKYSGVLMVHKATQEKQQISTVEISPLLNVARGVAVPDKERLLGGSLIDGILPFIYIGNSQGRLCNEKLFISLGESGMVLDQWALDSPDNDRLFRNWSKRIVPHLLENGNFPTDSVLIPVCLREEEHYILLVMDPLTRTALVVDSLNSARRVTKNTEEVARVFGNWLDNKGRLIKPYTPETPWDVKAQDTPLQSDGYSCGYVMMICAMEMISPDDQIPYRISPLVAANRSKGRVKVTYKDPKAGARFILNEMFRECSVFLTFPSSCF